MLMKSPGAGFLPDSLFVGSCWLLCATPIKIGEKLLKAWRGALRAFDGSFSSEAWLPNRAIIFQVTLCIDATTHLLETR